MKDYKRSINQAQELQYLADKSKITSTVVKTPPPPIEEPIEELTVVEEQPIIEEQPTEQPIEETKVNESISLVKKKKYDEQ
jgi:hypothetical protein